ncbi:hypothetical protein ACFFS2_03515 [Streptomyces aurantiacus]|nr:hypothetical protein [Streptomyces aurantiacus]
MIDLLKDTPASLLASAILICGLVASGAWFLWMDVKPGEDPQSMPTGTESPRPEPTQSKPTGEADPDPQEEYVEAIDSARKSLFEGSLTHSGLTDAELKSGTTYKFVVTVSGDWRLNADGSKGASVPAGGDIGVKLQCSGENSSCKALSTERQPVLKRTDQATWRWEVSPQKEGRLKLSLRVTAYFRDSDSVLVEQSPFRRTVRVVAVPEDSGGEGFEWIGGIWNGIVKFASELGIILSVIVTVPAAILALKARGRSSA